MPLIFSLEANIVLVTACIIWCAHDEQLMADKCFACIEGAPTELAKFDSHGNSNVFLAAAWLFANCTRDGYLSHQVANGGVQLLILLPGLSSCPLQSIETNTGK